MSRISSHFKEPKILLPHSQEPTTCFFPEPHQSCPCPIQLLKNSILILSPYLRLGLPSSLFHSGYHTKILYATFLSPCALHVPPVPLFLIRSHELYFGRNADPKAPTHTVVSIPLLPCPKKKQLLADFPRARNVRTSTTVHPASYSNVTAVHHYI